MSKTMGVVACGAAAMLLLTLGLRDATTVRRLRRHGIRTRGVVVDNVRVRSGDSGPTWAPVIAFADRRGHRVEFTTRMRGSGMNLPTGREVPVVYLAHDSQAARVLMWRHMTGPVVFLLAGSAIFLSFGVAIVLL
ncbi:DUF3592 domain-containing protein [Streptomyces sp. NPDC002514]|uniref:DUF3592 domain-containing protein n=1 Tax=Streptomyces sp. NPDC001270 TaxID=3364554 RepID=UPI0036C1C721